MPLLNQLPNVCMSPSPYTQPGLLKQSSHPPSLQVRGGLRLVSARGLLTRHSTAFWLPSCHIITTMSLRAPPGVSGKDMATLNSRFVSTMLAPGPYWSEVMSRGPCPYCMSGCCTPPKPPAKPGWSFALCNVVCHPNLFPSMRSISPHRPPKVPLASHCPPSPHSTRYMPVTQPQPVFPTSTFIRSVLPSSLADFSPPTLACPWQGLASLQPALCASLPGVTGASG